MVDKVSAISSTAAPLATRIQHSVSIAEPEIAWAATRQAAINADQPLRHVARDAPNEHRAYDGEDLGDRHLDHHHSQTAGEETHHPEERLSGESERIGTGNLDKDVPFGDHAGYV